MFKNGFWRIVCVFLHTFSGPGRRECSPCMYIQHVKGQVAGAIVTAIVNVYDSLVLKLTYRMGIQ